MSRPLLVIAFISTALGVVLSEAEARKWTDRSGKYSVEAELVDFQAGVARLRKTDGNVIAIRAELLSEADQQYLRNRNAPSLAATAADVLKRNCYLCHGQDGSDEGGMNYVINLQRLVDEGQVIAGEADHSPLMRRIEGGEMPPEGETPRPTTEEVAALKKWIAEGAPHDAAPQPRSFVAVEKLQKTIQADLEAMDERDRRHMRYLSITHLYNAGLSEDELQTFRLALAKLLNSLSWERELVSPAPLNAVSTLFRIDLRDLRWSAATWSQIAARYPYGVRHPGRAADEVRRGAGAEIPLLHGDWFVAEASRPPLYHAILQLPPTREELESLLRIDFAQNIRQDRAARAGFQDSGVSEHPRIIERHRTSDGACWLSYDFAGNTGDRNFFVHPLDFKADGSEVIFSLPNGLLAYMVFDAESKRLDKAPTSIVKDTTQVDAAVVNGISCMRCHAAGIIPKRDEVRPHVAASARAFVDQRDAVDALYVPDDQLQQLIGEDRRRFSEALGRLGITRLSAQGEPVFNTARRFRESLGADLAAAELDMTTAELQKRLDQHVSLQRVLGPLRVAGGSIGRDAFDEFFGKLAAELRMGQYIAPSTAPIDDAGEDRSRESGRLFDLGGRNRLPSFLEPPRAAVISDKNGLRLPGSTYVRTRLGNYMTKDFVFEVVYKSSEHDGVLFFGFGEGLPEPGFGEPTASIKLKIHPPNAQHKGVVRISRGGDGGGNAVGEVRKTGVHRVTIAKQGDSLTFSIDVDNDGPTSDDVERTLPDFKSYAPYLHEKNTHLYFGGAGAFTQVGLAD
ncbi:MAG: hypothetical protein KY475_16490 [Planctomycetes bacterium]|nr:hypothetical protein [Planctomycetota bacterium]